jgi:hypothetical protein
MIFPNRAPAPSLRPGMGYSSGAFHLGYVAHMGYAPGAITLGSFSSSEEEAALAAGVCTQSDLDLLNSLGATDQDLTDLINGNITLTQLYAQYGATIPAGSAASSAPLPLAPASAVASSVSAPAQVPSGSTLLYVCTVVGGPGDLTVSPTSAMSQFASQLNAHGMSVLSSNNNETVLNAVFGTGAAITFQFTILDSIGNALLSDAKSVCDGTMQSIVGNNVSTSNLSIVSTPGTASVAAAPAGSTDITTFLENNALNIGIVLGALILLNNFTGKKR